MSKKIIFCCLAVVVSIIPLISCSPAENAIGNLKDDPHFQQALQMFDGSSKPRSFPYPYSPLFNFLCANNPDGDYQYPYYCDIFIKCSGGQVFLEFCMYNLIFNPIADLCVYRPTYPDQDNCPWRSIWEDPANVRCETLGQRLFWPPLLFPANSTESCGTKTILCSRDSPPKNMECKKGQGYSKAFLACLKIKDCKAVDGAFKL